MNTIGIIALNSWKESLRNRFFVLSLVFGVLLLYFSLLLGLLASDQELRVLLDFGLGLIELIGLIGAIFGASTVILKEMETKTIYMVLTRPVSRWHFLVGRFLGLMMSVLAAMVLMAALHLAVLLAKGWSPQSYYLFAFIGSFFKILLTASLAVFLALFTTSVLSCLTITSIVWSLSHFLPEIEFMIAHKARVSVLGLPMRLMTYLLPNLQLYNLRDHLEVSLGSVMNTNTIHALDVPWGAWFLYAAVYCGVWLALSSHLLNRKEF